MSYLIRTNVCGTTLQKREHSSSLGEVGVGSACPYSEFFLQVSRSSHPIMEGIEGRNFTMSCVAVPPTPRGWCQVRSSFFTVLLTG